MESAILIGEAVKKNAGYIELERFGAARKIANTIQHR
jgi:hypothetical protein